MLSCVHKLQAHASGSLNAFGGRGKLQMSIVLGIDAAWTETGSSGVAVLQTDGNRRTVCALASSYEGSPGVGAEKAYRRAGRARRAGHVP